MPFTLGIVIETERSSRPKTAVYGIVTDGNLWQVGKLVVDTFTKNLGNFTIDNLSKVYGALENLVQLVEGDNYEQ